MTTPALLLCGVGMTWLLVQPGASATCTSIGTDAPRLWKFEKPGRTWQVSHWRGAAPANVVRVSLPANADVRLAADRVDVKARTSNGGIDVTLSGPPAEARLDIYVSYELEVNVDTSLTPAIDDFNTEGPIAVRCEVVNPR